MAVDVVLVLGNLRLIPVAVIPPCATLGVHLAGTPVSWPFAFAPAAVVAVIVAWKLVRQRSLKRPAKVWRGLPRESFAFDIIAVVAATLGLLYATRPWDEVFDVISATAMGGGFALGGSAVFLFLVPLWQLLARRGEGLYKNDRSSRGQTIAFLLMMVLFGGPVAGYFGSLPITLLYIEEVAGANPSFMSRETWLVLLTVLVIVPINVVASWPEMRKRIAKQNAR